MKHKHHLKPRHRGGTDADGIVEVSITCHAMFHYCEWRLWGMQEDLTAWKGLIGQSAFKYFSWEGRKHTEESKAKMRQSAKKRRNPKRSALARQNLSEGHKGKTLSEETRQKISNSLKGRKPSPEAIEKIRKKAIGRKTSEETKEKQRQGRLGKKHSEETKRKISLIRRKKSK